jgi:hypothetical protein
MDRHFDGRRSSHGLKKQLVVLSWYYHTTTSNTVLENPNKEEEHRKRKASQEEPKASGYPNINTRQRYPIILLIHWNKHNCP